MYKVIKLTEDTNPINNFTIGKVKSIEIIGDATNNEEVKVNLSRAVKYQTPEQVYIDTIPAEGTTVTCDKNYQLPLTYTHTYYGPAPDYEEHEDEVAVSQGGLKLYSVETDSEITSFKNGYWELQFSDDALASGNEQRHWTLTNFKYVDGVKTTVKQFSATSERGATPDTLTLRHTRNISDYDTITLILTDEEETIADIYCSGSVLTTIGWITHDDDVTIELLDVTLTSENMSSGRMIVDLENTFYANFDDVLSFSGETEVLRKLNIFIYIES